MKNVLITGGSRGIGAECVKLFSERGYRVFFIYRNNHEEAAKLSEITGALPFCGDVSVPADIENIYDKIKDHGGIDVIVNNAGISQIKMFCDITEAEWDRMFDVNIKGMYVVTHCFLSDMVRKKSGRIINISSMWGETGASCEVHYSASKAAVIGFTKALAKELAPSGITVNCVSPGIIATDMNSGLSDEELEDFVSDIPIQRIGDPRETAETVYFLASEQAGYITGAVVPVNGGLVI
mgnify:FL=1